MLQEPSGLEITSTVCIVPQLLLPAMAANGDGRKAYAFLDPRSQLVLLFGQPTGAPMLPAFRFLPSRNEPLALIGGATAAGDSVVIKAFFYALAFIWLDGFAVPGPAQVTQAVRWLGAV